MGKGDNTQLLYGGGSITVIGCIMKLHVVENHFKWYFMQVNESKAMLELENGALKAELVKRDFEIATLQISLKDKVNSISNFEHKLRMVHDTMS